MIPPAAKKWMYGLALCFSLVQLGALLAHTVLSVQSLFRKSMSLYRKDSISDSGRWKELEVTGTLMCAFAHSCSTLFCLLGFCLPSPKLHFFLLRKLVFSLTFLSRSGSFLLSKVFHAFLADELTLNGSIVIYLELGELFSSVIMVLILLFTAISYGNKSPDETTPKNLGPNQSSDYSMSSGLYCTIPDGSVEGKSNSFTNDAMSYSPSSTSYRRSYYGYPNGSGTLTNERKSPNLPLNSRTLPGVVKNLDVSPQLRGSITSLSMQPMD